MAQPATATSPRRIGALAGAVAALVLALAVVALAWGWARIQPPGAGGGAGSVPAGRADTLGRQVEVAFADALGFWGDGSGPGRIVFFAVRTGTPCAATPVSGPFYCPQSGTAAFDLAFLDTLAGRMQRDADPGVALVAARLAAEHHQRTRGLLDAAALRMVGADKARRAAMLAALAQQADCLTGNWAASRMPVPEGLYDRLIFSWENVVDDLGRQGIQVAAAFDPFATGTRAGHAAAFEAGRSGAACPPPLGLAAG